MAYLELWRDQPVDDLSSLVQALPLPGRLGLYCRRQLVELVSQHILDRMMLLRCCQTKGCVIIKEEFDMKICQIQICHSQTADDGEPFKFCLHVIVSRTGEDQIRVSPEEEIELLRRSETMLRSRRVVLPLRFCD
jgi:hypothetical protein